MTTDRSARRPVVLAGLLLAALAASHIAVGVLDELFEPLQAQAIDYLFVQRANLPSLAPAYDEALALVPIDDESLKTLEQYYVGRVEYARLVRNLGRSGVAAQFHDAIFAAPQDPEADRELIEATAQAPRVYYGMALGLSHGKQMNEDPPAPPWVRSLLDLNRWEVTLPPGGIEAFPRASSHFLTFEALARAAEGLGFLDIVPDRDGVYRRVPLLVRDGDGLLPSQALRVLCDWLEVPPRDVVVDPGRSITLRGARRPGAQAEHDIVVPVDLRNRLILNFVGSWGRMTHYPFGTVYDASDDRFMLEDLGDEIGGKIVFVAEMSTGTGDVGPVPTDAVYPLVGLQANTVNTILTENFLRELSPRSMFLFVELPLCALLFVAGLRLQMIPFVAVAAGLLVSYAALVALAFLYGGWILSVPAPVMTLVGATVIVAAWQFHLESRARAVLRTTFDAYFPPSVVDKVMGQSDNLAAAASKKELTILFSDIKSFTTHTSAMQATQVRKLLNEYFEKMIEIVFRHDGTLDKFIGDGLMVFFGDPQPQPDHAARCVRAAIEMQQAARKLNAEWARRGDMPLEIRVGINTGEVIVGNMGSARRLSYTVLGEPVNLAQRLESNAPVNGILISQRTWELLDGAVPTRGLEPILVKGIDRPIAVHEVPVDDAGA